MNLKDLDITRIHKAFSPAQDIRAPQRFVGRKQEIETGMVALLNYGGFLAIFGLRGVGKSSIAYQLKLIAEGDKILPNVFGFKSLIPKKGFRFLAHYIRCDRFIQNIGDLLKRLMFGDDDNPSLFSLTKTGDKRLTEFKKILKGEGGLGFFGAKLGASGTKEKTYKAYVSDDIVQQFRQLLGTIRKDNQDKTGLLILIDEFDAISNKEGFASLVKSCSSDFVKFGVIGIATSITELVKEHTSIGRKVDIIRVPLMPLSELIHILRRAEHIVDHAIIFEDSAAQAIADRAQGFPYFVHLLGREAMLMTFKRMSLKVTDEDIEQLAHRINDGRLSTIYEEIFQDAVKHSAQRELLLKIFAEQEEDEIHTEEVYALAKELGVTNPSQLMKELTTLQDKAAVLVKVRERYFRFSDPVFKIYARIRNWKY